MLDRKIAPAITDAVNFDLHLKPYGYFELNNGVPVYTVDAGAQDLLQMEMVFYAGNWFEQQKGVAAATNFMLKNGTGSRTAFQINEHFDYFGAYCNRHCYNETAVLTLHTLNKHLEKLLPVVNDMLTDSVFPESELEIYKQNSRQRLEVNLKKAEFVAGRLIDAALYGEQHPYGVYTNMPDVDAIQSAPLKSFYQQYYLQGNCVIFVSGKIPANLPALLNQHFGSLHLKKSSFEVLQKPSFPSAEKKIRIQNDVNAVQGAIRIAQPFPNRHHPDFKKVMVLNNLFGGFFGSRLMANIREDKGYTYGIYSYLQNHTQQSAWLISTEAGKDVCEATVEEVYKEMKILREEPVSADELLVVQNYMMGTILGDLDGPFQIMAKWKNIILNALDESYFYGSVEAIKNITPAEMQELANKYLHPEKFYEMLVY